MKAADKRRLTEGIEELSWVAALEPGTVAVPAYRDAVREYLEIAGIADTLVETVDPGQGVINPQPGFAGGFGGGDLTPFVMATPHHAPAHMIQAQLGAQPALGAAAAGPGLKPIATDTAKELAFETVFQLDRPKQRIFDTRKELVYETWVETGPNTIQETTFDPGGLVTQPPIWGFPCLMF